MYCPTLALTSILFFYFSPLTGRGGVAGATHLPRGGEPHAGEGGRGVGRPPRLDRAAAQVAGQRQEAPAHGRGCRVRRRRYVEPLLWFIIIIIILYQKTEGSVENSFDQFRVVICD